MTIDVGIEKTPYPSLKKGFAFFPKGIKEAGGWLILPYLFLFLTMTFVLFHECPFSPYFSYIALLGCLLSTLFRAKGFCLFAVIGALILFSFFSEIKNHIGFIEMGLFCSITLNSLFAWLVGEEMEWVLVQNEKQSLDNLLKVAKEKEDEEARFSKEKELLNQEIQRWIEESKLRRLEKVAEEKRYSLLEMQQKQLLSEAQDAHKKLEELQVELEKKNQEIEALLKAPHEIQENVTLTAHDKCQIGQLKQLRLQFEEKSKVLSQARRELFQAEGKLLAYEKEQSLEMDEETHAKSMKSLFFALKDNELLEEEIKALEELISRILNP